MSAVSSDYLIAFRGKVLVNKKTSTFNHLIFLIATQQALYRYDRCYYHYNNVIFTMDFQQF